MAPLLCQSRDGFMHAVRTWISRREVTCQSLVQLEYDLAASLSQPFPNRIRAFIEHAEAKPGVPNSEITVHSVRLSDKPVEDAAFDPSSRLKAGSFVRGVMTPEGREFVPDPTDRMFVHELVK